MIQLFVVGSGWGVPFASAAPFPLKLETWLRMAEIPYELVIENDVSRGPKKKTPWIVDDDLRMGDSELIIEHLSRKHGVDLDGHLTALDRAHGLAFQRTFEEHYHQAYEHELFLGAGGATRLREFASALPPLLRAIVPVVLRTSLRRQLYARGLGRHRPREIVAMGQADLDAASSFLASKPFFLGEAPSSVDATAFGFLATSVYVEGDNPLFSHAASLENLVAYCDRMRARYFPETMA